jgi:hypothetical protein
MFNTSIHRRDEPAPCFAGVRGGVNGRVFWRAPPIGGRDEPSGGVTGVHVELPGVRGSRKNREREAHDEGTLQSTQDHRKGSSASP